MFYKEMAVYVRSCCCYEGGELLGFSNRGDEVVFGRTEDKYLVSAEVNLSSHVQSLSTS